jgi:hypothetical protein
MTNNYGTLPTVAAGAPRRRQLRTFPTLLIGMALAAAAAMALVTIGAVLSNSEGVATHSLLSLSHRTRRQGLAADSNGAASSVSSTVNPPRDDEWKQYLDGANAVLQRVGLSQEKLANKTDFANGCGALLLPCIATVGACVSENLVDASGDHVSANPNACQCFVRGLAEPISVPNQPTVQVTCSYQCLESIRSAFEVRTSVPCVCLGKLKLKKQSDDEFLR